MHRRDVPQSLPTPRPKALARSPLVEHGPRVEISVDATLLRESETLIERAGVLDPRVGEEAAAPRV